jgi:hypothetical protein
MRDVGDGAAAAAVRRRELRRSSTRRRERRDSEIGTGDVARRSALNVAARDLEDGEPPLLTAADPRRQYATDCLQVNIAGSTTRIR